MTWLDAVAARDAAEVDDWEKESLQYIFQSQADRHHLLRLVRHALSALTAIEHQYPETSHVAELTAFKRMLTAPEAPE